MTSIKFTRAFRVSRKNALKKYAQSTKHVDKVVDSLKENPYQGVRWPGFSELSVRKLRVDLPEYKISSRKGLRLIYLHHPGKDIVCPLLLVKKATYQEQELMKQTKEALKKVLQELEQQD